MEQRSNPIDNLLRTSMQTFYIRRTWAAAWHIRPLPRKKERSRAVGGTGVVEERDKREQSLVKGRRNCCGREGLTMNDMITDPPMRVNAF